jgi:hypothetical protein
LTERTSPAKAVFTPDDEPYLGRQSVFHFDQVILSCLEANAEVAAFTRAHASELSDLQKAACQIIPPGHQPRPEHPRAYSTGVSLRGGCPYAALD